MKRKTIRAAAAELQEQTARAVLAGVQTLPAIARAVGYSTWGKGGRYMQDADRERLKRALAALQRSRRAYRDARGLWLPYDYQGHLRSLHQQEAVCRARVQFHVRAGDCAQRAASRLWLAALELEQEGPNHEPPS